MKELFKFGRAGWSWMRSHILGDGRLLVWSTLICGTCLSLVIFSAARNWEERQIKEQFDAAADNRISAFRRELGAGLSALETLAELCGKSPHEDFQRTLELVRAARHSRMSTAAFHWEGPNPRTVDPGMMETVWRARTTGRMALSTPMRLAGGQSGVSAVMPVYLGGKRLDSAQDRQRLLLGFIVARYAPGAMMEEGLRYLRPYGINVALHDKSLLPAQSLIYFHRSRHASPPAASGPLPFRLPGPASLKFSTSVPVGNRQWEVVCTSIPAVLEAGRTFGPFGILTGTLLITLLSAVCLGLYVAHTGRIQELVDQRTRQLRQANLDLAVARDQALESARLKSQFLANISHEIRTPMNGILGMTELTLDTEVSSVQRDYLSSIRHSAECLLTIINDLLDFSKMESGGQELDPIDFDLRRSLEEIVRLMAVRAHQKGLELIADIDPELPPAIVGDPTKLRQIFVNLINNAIKFTEHGEVVVRVRGVRREDRELELIARVSDTGIGIPAEKLTAIFEPFQQADGTITRKYGGTGLGLTIAARLTELMQGKIWVSSRLGEGSDFHFTARVGVSSMELPEESAADGRLEGVRVLIVDDNATNLRILQTMASNWSMRPTVASSAAEALEHYPAAAAEGDPYCLVITDALMPGIDGFTLAARLRALRPTQDPIIMMLSSADLQTTLQQCRAHGIALYLVKPASQSSLKEAIVRALQGSAPRPSAARPSAQATAPEPLPAAVEPATRGLSVLLAEDNQINERLATRLLAKFGHRVTAVSDGQEAVNAFRQHVYDLVLMDLQVPRMDGWQATAAIRELEQGLERQTPIVALTANAFNGVEEQCLRAGMAGYLSKPFRSRDLEMAIQSAIGAQATGRGIYSQPGACITPPLSG